MKFFNFFLVLFFTYMLNGGEAKKMLSLPSPEGIYLYNSYHKNSVKELACQHSTDLLDYVKITSSDAKVQREFADQIAPFLNDKCARVYIKNNKVAGFITHSNWRPLHYEMFKFPDRKAQIAHVAVDKSCQNCGIGTKLMHNVLGSFREKPIETVRLAVIHDIGTLDDFYKKFGFKAERTSKSLTTLYMLRLGMNPFVKALKKIIDF